MSRWIDAEWLSKLFPDTGEGDWTYNATAQGYIDSAPSIDIVRCKECKYWIGHIADDDGFDGEDECRWRDSEAPNPDDYCSYGEREGD